MAYNIRLWTGFIPSRASGNARPNIIDNAYCMKDDETSVGKSITFCDGEFSSNSLAAFANSDSETKAAFESYDPASSVACDSCSRMVFVVVDDVVDDG